MNIKMVGLDLDRTTLRSNHEMSKETEETLRKAADQGVHVIIATGRSFYSMEVPFLTSFKTSSAH